MDLKSKLLATRAKSPAPFNQQLQLQYQEDRVRTLSFRHFYGELSLQRPTFSVFKSATRPTPSRQSGASTSSSNGKPYMSLDSGRGGAPYHMTYYSKPPMDEMTLEEFEMWAIDRLRGASFLETFDSLIPWLGDAWRYGGS